MSTATAKSRVTDTLPGVTPGAAAPIGATVLEGGTNFSVYARDATALDLLLFDHADDATPARTIRFDLPRHRSFNYWHAFVPGVGPGQIYGYRAHGPNDPAQGLRFDPEKLLLDPYAKGVVVPPNYDRFAGARPGDNAAVAMKGVVANLAEYDWEGDQHPRIPNARSVIYEMHVRAFTRHPNSGLPDTTRGTYAGLIQKIPYLKELGVTAVELLPVFQFDPQACPPGVVNFWGYQPVSFFAPHAAYSSRRDPLGPIDEFRDMVKALHRAGIEVILDVVYNHTAEGDHDGPMQSFRGLDNRAYYMLDPADRARYADFSGCGNTFNSNHPAARRMVLDSLRHWVHDMHVDGFRFDLASILARDPSGRPLPEPPVLLDIESDPSLAHTKFIAEAWDAAGLYQVGSFVGDAWKEWNGRFRDDARQFFRGDAGGAARRFADRIVGSPEVYGAKQREPEQSVNFVTCHDGFTLNDLVSYAHKHNEANNDENRDGANDNFSWNCGLEGPTHHPAIDSVRNRQVKNLLASTFLSVGVPMILMGDEVRRTQKGNNNAYCHDSEIAWFDWSGLERHADVLRFVRTMIAQRVQRPDEHEKKRLTLNQVIAGATCHWHGTELNQPNWDDWSRTIALTVEQKGARRMVHLIFNAHDGALDFALPPTPAGPDGKAGKAGGWRRWIDTSLPSPDDVVAVEQAAPVAGDRYRAGPQSVVVLISDLERTPS
ncbi:MAG: glycogen debranching protein GlgX [Phycisphaerae bacterium]|nr:glycogen debranching protein GlgX [Tepidisphaeraceae bacterium]